MNLRNHYYRFLSEPTAEHNRSLSTIVYEHLTGFKPNAKVVHVNDHIYPFDSTTQIGGYNIFTNTCTVKQLDIKPYMVTVLGHELCHAQARKMLKTQYEEARVELFELCFARYLEEQLSEGFTIPINGKSKLLEFEDAFKEKSSTQLLGMYHNFERASLDLGLSWITKILPNI